MSPQSSTAFADVAELDTAAPAACVILSARRQCEVVSNALAVVMERQRLDVDVSCRRNGSMGSRRVLLSCLILTAVISRR
jgi:hypothetical protein